MLSIFCKTRITNKALCVKKTNQPLTNITFFFQPGSSVSQLCSYFNNTVIEEECLDALEATCWNFQESVKYLKINNLLR